MSPINTMAAMNSVRYVSCRRADESRLVTSARLGRVRACAALDCGWWFLDDTKNASRRWCDMKICGNRQKVRSYRERHHRPHALHG